MKDYYAILGLPRNCNLAEIKKAYRNLAKRHHPDKVHGGNCSEFHEVQEAYETLSEHDRRKDYDGQLRKSETRSPISHRDTSVALQIMTDFPFFRFSNLDQSLHSFPDLAFIPEPHYTMELILTPSEATSGGAVPLDIPIHETCNECRGTGFIGFYFCDVCQGAGVVNHTRRVILTYPADVKHHERFETFVRGFGTLQITVKIYEH